MVIDFSFTFNFNGKVNTKRVFFFNRNQGIESYSEFIPFNSVYFLFSLLNQRKRRLLFES